MKWGKFKNLDRKTGKKRVERVREKPGGREERGEREETAEGGKEGERM